MTAAPPLAGWDTGILVLPFLLHLGLWMFGLDVRAAAPRREGAPCPDGSA